MGPSYNLEIGIDIQRDWRETKLNISACNKGIDIKVNTVVV